VIGTMTVMGIQVRILEDALFHTPTKTSLDESNPLTIESFAYERFPGRREDGFIGGTAIITGDSIGGQVYATDVFSDLFENVVVGEATGTVQTPAGVDRATINGMKIRRSTDKRMPAGPAINSFGLRVKEAEITSGSLVSAEGYYSSNQDTLFYHTIEADGAPLLRTDTTQVGILRASCRIRGGGRDEVEVRGGAVNPADATVQIRLPDPTPNNPNRFTSIGIVQAVPQAAPVPTDPPQGLFRADFRNLTIPGGVCPTRVRAVILTTSPGALNQATATANMTGR